MIFLVFLILGVIVLSIVEGIWNSLNNSDKILWDNSEYTKEKCSKYKGYKT